MKRPTLDCRSERRHNEVRRHQRNGLDYLEVSDDQLRLKLYFLGEAPKGVSTENFKITGGQRIRDIEVLDVKTCPQVEDDLDNCVVVTVDKPGDFSTYQICLVNLPEDAAFDPRYRCLAFSFKAACPTDLDCKSQPSCPPELRPEPDISYLAKDYASFRRLILDRLAVVMPEWRERHVPDLGITLVELLAYIGDTLSYAQDAVATEAYLDTARQRVSVRRHARLVDYLMHEGCNARSWVHVHAPTDATLPGAQLSFLTTFDQAPEVTDRLLRWQDLRSVPASRYEVFEPLLEDPGAELDFYSAHNEIVIYTWGDRECCLPRGATSATLVDGPARPPEVDVEPNEDGDGKIDDHEYGESGTEACDDDGVPDVPHERVLKLEVGDLLIFEEVIGPRTADPDDADPNHRHAVRLTRVERIVDELYGQPLLEIGWSEEDALPFPLCVSIIGPPPECVLLENVSVARGNVLLVDHGRRLDEPEQLGCVPVEAEDVSCEREGRPSDLTRRPGRFRPILGEDRLTFGEPLEHDAPAARLLEQDPRKALPWVRLSSRPGCADDPQPHGPDDEPSRQWTARRDLLASGTEDDHYVVEMDDRRRAHLRFGDGELGRQPDGDLAFSALYRTGNGPVGNVGADTLVLAVTDELFSGVTLLPRNPLPALGGTAPEPVVDVQLFAPHAFRQVLERAITADDYAHLAGQYPAVQGAAAELRWNGSWYEARVAVDPLGRAEADAALLAEVEGHLYRYRRIGHDLAVRGARYVPLDLVLCVCVESSFLRGHVKAALVQLFSAHCLPDGSLGFFHPDALSFGDDISLSRLVAAAQAVAGVESVTVAKLERLFEGPNGEIEHGTLPIGPLEIARLDNDPNFPENGRIQFDLGGGR